VSRTDACQPNAGRTTIPLFFFNLCTADGVDRDDEGVDLPDIETAYLEAFHTATEMWIEAVRHRRDPSKHHFEITDARGQLLMTVPFNEVIAKRPVARPQSPARSETRDRQTASALPRLPWPRQEPLPDIHAIFEQALAARRLGATVIDQIAVARERLQESRALLEQLGGAGRGS